MIDSLNTDSKDITSERVCGVNGRCMRTKLYAWTHESIVLTEPTLKLYFCKYICDQIDRFSVIIFLRAGPNVANMKSVCLTPPCPLRSSSYSRPHSGGLISWTLAMPDGWNVVGWKAFRISTWRRKKRNQEESPWMKRIGNDLFTRLLCLAVQCLLCLWDAVWVKEFLLGDAALLNKALCLTDLWSAP